LRNETNMKKKSVWSTIRDICEDCDTKEKSKTYGLGFVGNIPLIFLNIHTVCDRKYITKVRHYLLGVMNGGLFQTIVIYINKIQKTQLGRNSANLQDFCSNRPMFNIDYGKGGKIAGERQFEGM
jgi:hypothetical protein